jgi:hypothetical protein
MHCSLINAADVAAHVVTVLTAFAAAFWFFFTASFRKRIEFNVKCTATPDPRNTGEKFIELVFELQNKGQVESRCYTLAYELQSVEAASKKERRVLKRSGNIVPVPAGYYYVRAGVTLRVTDHLWVPSDVSILRVKAFILYDRQRHEVREDVELFEQMYGCDDWTSLDRTFGVSSSKQEVANTFKVD